MSIWRTIRRGFNSLQLVMWTFTFGVGILLVAVVVLKLFLPAAPPKQIDHAELLRQLDAGNVEEAHFLRSGNGVEIDGELRNPSENFEARVAEGEIENLQARLRAKGVSATVSNEIPRGSFGYYAAFAFFILFFVAFFLIARFQIRRLRRRGVELKNRGTG